MDDLILPWGGVRGEGQKVRFFLNSDTQSWSCFVLVNSFLWCLFTLLRRSSVFQYFQASSSVRLRDAFPPSLPNTF